MQASRPYLFALFQKRVDGDDALLRLARIRFEETGLGAELYGESAAELNHILHFVPKSATPVFIHLPRDINLLDQYSIQRLFQLVTNCPDNIYGLVIHDQPEIKTNMTVYQTVLKQVDRILGSMPNCPLLFIEFASGLPPELFCRLFESIHDLKHISACIDVGHIGIWQARHIFYKKYPGKDICNLDPSHPELREIVTDVEDSVRGALPKVLDIIRILGQTTKPLHFHLHDGHPLSTSSPFGVSDHLSFFAEIPIPFSYQGKKSLQPMFGPSGLAAIVSEALKVLGPDLVTFTLEIHPASGRLSLGAADCLFQHWTDKTNAEQMNYWLSILLENSRLLRRVIEAGRYS